MTEPFDLWLWVSPWDNYRTIGSLVDAASRVRLPGFRTGILIPTLYGEAPQSLLKGNLGTELRVAGPESAGALRAMIEAQGLRCGGWSVPRGQGNVASEGHAHGVIASTFDYFMLNFEQGWPDFWTSQNPDVVNTFLGAFWNGVADAGGTQRLSGHVGLTMVTNSGMMQSVTNPEAAAWIGGTNFDALEAYIPGDVGLDPANALRIWNARLQALGVSGRSVVPILENGDLPALCAQFADPVHGVQVWTLTTAASHIWPDVPVAPVDPPTPEPVPTTDPCQGVIDQRDGLIQSLGYLGGDALEPVARLKFGYLSKSVQNLVTALRTVCDSHGITHH